MSLTFSSPPVITADGGAILEPVLEVVRTITLTSETVVYVLRGINIIVPGSFSTDPKIYVNGVPGIITPIMEEIFGNDGIPKNLQEKGLISPEKRDAGFIMTESGTLLQNK